MLLGEGGGGELLVNSSRCSPRKQERESRFVSAYRELKKGKSRAGRLKCCARRRKAELVGVERERGIKNSTGKKKSDVSFNTLHTLTGLIGSLTLTHFNHAASHRPMGFGHVLRDLVSLPLFIAAV